MAIRHEDLVDRAERLALSLPSKREEREEGKSQLSKAIEVARASGSVRVFENWLLYQAGRASGAGSRFWAREIGQGRGTLAEALYREVDQLVQEYPKESQEALLWFLGYFRRAVVASELLRELRGSKA